MNEFERLSAQEVLAWAVERFGDSVAVSTSFQREGMAVIDMAVQIKPDIRVFTLDTGFLHEETLRFIGAVESHYGIRVERVLPDAGEVEEMVRRHGAELFYLDVPRRMLCCQVRKVRPLARKLASLEAWITGLRRSQNRSRAGIRKVEAGDGAYKISPLADWGATEVQAYIDAHGVPVHPLYERGFMSIGCGPCTRAAGEGEDERAGRWWWERDSVKECGIHFSADGRAERTVDVLLREIVDAQSA